jgi:hypothetical protein
MKRENLYLKISVSVCKELSKMQKTIFGVNKFFKIKIMLQIEPLLPSDLEEN